MEILKRIINLICALWVMSGSVLWFTGNIEFVDCLTFIGGTALFFSVINFALFKNFTIWNK